MICEEYKEVLVAAWENEEAEREKKEKEVRITLRVGAAGTDTARNW